MRLLLNGFRGSVLFLVTALVATVLLTGLSWSALVHEYGFGDDFIAWMWYMDDRFNPADSMFTKHGRYVLSYMIDGAYSAWTDFGDLWKIRLLGIVGWGAVTALVFHWVLPAKWSWRWRAVHTCGAILTPAIGISIGYSVCFPFAWGSVVALGSGVLARRCLAAASWWARLAQGLLSVFGVAIAYMIYQPLAFFFLYPLLVEAKGLNWKRLWADRWVGACVLFAVGTLLYGVVYMQIKAGFDAADAGAHRGSLGPISIERLVLLGQFLWWGIESWGAFLSPWPAGLIGLGVLVLAAIGTHRGPGWVITIVTLLAAVALPLVVREVNFFTRLLVVVYAVVAFLALEGARTILEGWKRSPRGFGPGAAVAFVGLMGVSFSGFLHYGIVKPCVDELAWARAQAAALEKPAKRLWYVMPDSATARSWPGRSLAEYGRTISCVAPNAKTLVAFVYWERFAEELSMPRRFFPGRELTCFSWWVFEEMEAEGAIPEDVVVWRGDLFLKGYREAIGAH